MEKIGKIFKFNSLSLLLLFRLLAELCAKQLIALATTGEDYT
jgi:hypothetical protein